MSLHHNSGYNHKCNGVFYPDPVPGMTDRISIAWCCVKKIEGDALENELVDAHLNGVPRLCHYIREGT